MRRTLATALGGVALLAGIAGPAVAAGKTAPTVHRQFTEVEAGTRLSSDGLRYEDVYKVKSGPFGAGTTTRDAILTGDSFPASGQDTATGYFHGGRLTANETFTLGPPHTDGVGAITGTGTCQSGTYQHQDETCTYTLKGSYDLVTGQTFLTLSGTYTPAAGK